MKRGVNHKEELDWNDLSHLASCLEAVSKSYGTEWNCSGEAQHTDGVAVTARSVPLAVTHGAIEGTQSSHLCVGLLRTLSGPPPPPFFSSSLHHGQETQCTSVNQRVE